MLHDLELGDGQNLGTADGRIALDCSVRKTEQGHYCISTTDFFFPLVDSPYLQGRIGACNVLSDLYAEGTGRCDFMLMLLAACRDMPDDERKVCTTEMVRGFRDCCTDAGTVITGGQTVLNPWPIIGGVATTIVREGEFVSSDGANAGDVLVLTKPLGTQIAVNVHQWRTTGHRLWKECADKDLLTEAQADDLMHEACCSMSRLNRTGSELMVKYGATAATDVTGFGILGHAQNLAENQVNDVCIELHTLPCLRGSVGVNNEVFNFRLLTGYSAETSGGLMVCLPEDKAEAFRAEVEERDGCPAWIIGRVVEGGGKDTKEKAKVVEDVKILEV